jgi:hypothetical protein
VFDEGNFIPRQYSMKILWKMRDSEGKCGILWENVGKLGTGPDFGTGRNGTGLHGVWDGTGL